MGAEGERGRLELLRGRVVVEIVGPKKRVAALTFSTRFKGGRGGYTGFWPAWGRTKVGPPLIRRRGRGEPMSEEEETGEASWCAVAGKATGPLCRRRLFPGIPDYCMRTVSIQFLVISTKVHTLLGD